MNTHSGMFEMEAIMTVLVTGAFGNVGRSTVRALLEQGDAVACFDLPSKRNLGLARKPERLFSLNPAKEELAGWTYRLRFHWGDIRKTGDIEKALLGVDSVIHLAALIPPAADANPSLAFDVNVGGTKALLSCIASLPQPPLLVYASSIAVYGDRLADPDIRVADPLKPTPGDAYGTQKAACETLIRASGLPWLVLRLSYIVWRKKIEMDPLMFRMPLDTKIEVCHTEDAGRAFAHATRLPEAAGSTYNIGGGLRCRTTYRDYLDRMLSFFGLGGMRRLPEAAFASKGYHCGYLDSDEADRALGFQRKTIEEYYAEVKADASRLRVWARAFSWAIRKAILRRSPFRVLARKAAAEKRVLARAGKRSVSAQPA
jgi:nucleoside-diphosphate-sugar epimerase